MGDTQVVVKQLGGYIGAEIQGVDLAQPISDADAARIHEAVLRHHVVFFRGQDLSDEQHLVFASRFGNIVPGSAIDSDDLQFLRDTADNPPLTDEWHTDMSCFATPPTHAFLYAIEVPPWGGDTIWVSLAAAYEALSDRMRELVEELHVQHGFGPGFEAAITAYLQDSGLDPEKAAQKRTALKEQYTAVHPLVRPHPLTGRKVLFLSPRFTQGIIGCHQAESDALLSHLATHLENPNFQIRWRWQSGDLAMWDEPSTNHRALADHFAAGPQFRFMRRCVTDGTCSWPIVPGTGSSSHD